MSFDMRLVQTVYDCVYYMLFLGTVKCPFVVWFKTTCSLLGCAFFVQQIPSVSVKSVS